MFFGVPHPDIPGGITSSPYIKYVNSSLTLGNWNAGK